ncbi:MAG: FIST C-terminal domain-containing protein [Steroidobacteraceae bacterium]|nr:FIST C-terminal domain-containing protein [Steroidobacteraceae bacterium]
MAWASAMGLSSRLEDAATTALAQLDAASGLGRPDLVIAFASAAYGAAIDRLPRLLRSSLGDALLAGCNAGGLISGGGEEEDEPGVVLLAGRAPDAAFVAVHLEQATLPPLTASREQWWRLLDLGPESGASFVLLADPGTIDAEACARGVDRAYPGATVIGGLASGSMEAGTARLLTDDDAHRSGAVLLAFAGNVAIDAVVAQGCRPVGDPLFVTAGDGNLVHELDGRRPREVLTALFASLGEAERARFGDSLSIGIALPGSRQSVGAGDFLVRNVLGLDPDSGALWIGARIARNAVVQFHLRDAQAASQELESRLDAALKGRSPPAAALLFACAGRGRSLFGVSGHDSGSLLRRADVPLAGMFSAGEIAPIQGATFVHGYTSVFGLIRPRSTAGT